MGAITLYALQSALLLAVIYILYRWTLSGSTFCRFNRRAILLSYAIAFLALPMCGLLQAEAADETPEAAVQIIRDEVAMLSEAPAPAWPTVVSALYLAGIAVASILTARSIWNIRGIIRDGSKTRRDGYVVVLSDRTDISPFSWGKYIVMPTTACGDDADLIEAHEKAHLIHKHWIDLAAAQLVIIFNWFNPAAYLMMRELQDVHEFEADRDVINSGINKRQYQMLLLRNAANSMFPLFADSLNHSQLKTRLKLMAAPRSNPLRKLLIALPVPAVIAAVFAMNSSAVASHLGEIGRASLFAQDYGEVVYSVEGNVHSISYQSDGMTTSVSMEVASEPSPSVYINRHLASRGELSSLKSADVEWVLSDNVNNRFVVKTK